jgi:predicted nucleic-acid-binding protein
LSFGEVIGTAKSFGIHKAALIYKIIVKYSCSFGALLDPIIYSDECEISFSDVIQIDRNISDHDATSASLPYTNFISRKANFNPY